MKEHNVLPKSTELHSDQRLLGHFRTKSATQQHTAFYTVDDKIGIFSGVLFSDFTTTGSQRTAQCCT